MSDHHSDVHADISDTDEPLLLAVLGLNGTGDTSDKIRLEIVQPVEE